LLLASPLLGKPVECTQHQHLLAHFTPYFTPFGGLGGQGGVGVGCWVSGIA